MKICGGVPSKRVPLSIVALAQCCPASAFQSFVIRVGVPSKRVSQFVSIVALAMLPGKYFLIIRSYQTLGPRTCACEACFNMLGQELPWRCRPANVQRNTDI